MTVPSCAEEALSMGWRMVCVLPTALLKPPHVLELIKRRSIEVAYFKFTRKGKPLKRGQNALWVKISWSKKVRNLLLHTYCNGNPTLDQFVKDIVGDCMPEIELVKGKSSLARARNLHDLLRTIGPMEEYESRR